MSSVATLTGIERYLAEFELLTARLPDEPAAITTLRRTAMQRFGELGFPTRKNEEWRFTNVAPIARTAFRIGAGDRSTSASELGRFDYDDCARAVTVNGRWAPSLSDLQGLPESVTVTGLADAIARSPEKIEPWLGRLAPYAEQAFTAWNTAFFEDGILIHVPPGVVVERPLNLIMAALPQDEPLAFFPRVLVVAEESSQIKLVEQYVTLGEGPYYVGTVAEVETGPNAVVDHYKLQRESTAALHTASLGLRQERDSNFSSHSISWGGGLVRNDVHALLDGEGCEATLNGLYMVEGDQVVDNHMRVEHAKPHCDSHELYKGILDGRSRAVFSGRIFVHEGAQKTDAKQTNRNLLLSPEALCNSHPQLEIFADDVRCTHGSTVGQLDEVAIFYLRSRGIGEEAAKSLLTYAFAADVVERIRIDPVRRDLEEFLFRRLPKGDIVRQAV